jgi:hypothetical protein
LVTCWNSTTGPGHANREEVCIVYNHGEQTVTAMFEEIASYVLIPPTTKVVEGEALAALTTFGADGRLTFASTTPWLAALEVGDVLVAGPSVAAPSGLLRRVASDPSPEAGGGLRIETEAAFLREAIHHGALTFVHELTAEDLESAIATMDGVTLSPAAVGLSGDIDKTFTADAGDGREARIRISGTYQVKPLLDVDLRITCDRTVLGVCAEIPDLAFMAVMEVREELTATLTGELAAEFKPDPVQLAFFEFKPITRWIGSVPVVFRPRLTLALGVHVTLDGTLEVGLVQTLTLKRGMQYNSDTGFQVIEEQHHAFDFTSHGFSYKLDAMAYLDASVELLLFGLGGPYAELRGGPHVAVDLMYGLPGRPGISMITEMCLRLTAGLKANSVLGIGSWDTGVYEECFELGGLRNHLPVVSITAPTESADIKAIVGAKLVAKVDDPDTTDTHTCTWQSNAADDQLSAGGPFPPDGLVGCDITVAFPTEGPRELTVVAKDSRGAQATDSVRISVAPAPAFCCVRMEGVEADGVYPYHGSGLALRGLVSHAPIIGTQPPGTSPFSYEWKVQYVLFWYEGIPHYWSATIGDQNEIVWRPIDTFPNPTGDRRVRVLLKVTDAVGRIVEVYRWIWLTHLY